MPARPPILREECHCQAVAVPLPPAPSVAGVSPPREAASKFALPADSSADRYRACTVGRPRTCTSLGISVSYLTMVSRSGPSEWCGGLMDGVEAPQGDGVQQGCALEEAVVDGHGVQVGQGPMGLCQLLPADVPDGPGTSVRLPRMTIGT